MPQIIRNNVNEENRKQIESFLAQLELDKGLDLIKKIFEFISKLVSESILYNQKRLADLFCRTIQSIEIGEFSLDIQICVINAFKNINKVVINNPEEGNTCILYLLSILYRTRKEPDSEQITKLIDSGFINLINDLDKISIIFAMKDDHQTKFFPIENFLCKILEINNFIRDLNKPETIQALMFALQVFDKKNYPTEIQDILKIVKDYNLEFINYLYNGAYHCYENWKNDYEKNGSLILYDERKHKVLIRNPKESYFTQNEMCNNYCLSEIRRELNSSKDVIAYFIEYELEISDYVELEDELVKKGNKSGIIDILSLIYDYGYYNILGLRKLIFKDKKLLPINPFSYNDAYCFINAKPERYSLSHISNFLKDKYGLVRVIGKGINYVNIGTLVLLQSISNVGIKRLDFNNKIKTVSDLLCEWLELCSDKMAGLNSFLREFDTQISFIKSKSNFYTKYYSNEFLLPLPITLEITEKLEIASIIKKGEIVKCKVEKEFFNNKKTITVKEKDFSDYTIKNLEEDSIDIENGEYVVLLDKDTKAMVYDQRITLYDQIKEKINELNGFVLNSETVDVILDKDINDLEKYMILFKDHLSKIHGNVPLDSIVRFRLAYHILFIELSSCYFNQWLELIKKHECIDFSKLKNNEALLSQPGVLYIPKNRSMDQSTLKNLYYKYIRNQDNRQQTDLYDPYISYDDKYYLINNNRIKEICFVFDLIQKGNSSLGTIENFFDEEKTVNKPKFIDLRYKDKESNDEIKITAKEIIDKNKNGKNGCHVTVLALYAAQQGLNNIKDYFEQKEIKYKEKEPVNFITRTLSREDYDFIKGIYRGQLTGKIEEGDYLCIREFNQPEKNIMSDDLLDLNKIIGLFNRK